MIAIDPSILVFNGIRFDSVELEGEFWLRSDELGRTLVLEPPEEAIDSLYAANPGQFSERLTALIPVETSTGPRPMRVFNLLGAYVLCTFLDTLQSRMVRRWLLETLVFLQIDVKREIRRLTEEIRKLRAEIDALRNAAAGDRAKVDFLEGEFRRLFDEQGGLIRRLAEEVRASRPAVDGIFAGAPLDADYRRLSEEQAEQAGLLRGLVGQVSGFLERLPEELALAVEDARLFAIADDLGPLAAAVASLKDRLDKALRPPARRDAAQAARNAGGEPGVAALAAPEFQFLSFGYRDAGSLHALLFRDRPAPWFLVSDLRPLLGLAELPAGPLAEAVARIVPEPHRDATGDGFPMVDPVGVDALLWAWGDPFGNDATEDLWAWIAGTVLPSLHAAMLHEARLDPSGETHPGFPRAPVEVAAEGPFKVYRGELDGRPCKLVAGRDLHKFLALGWRQFGDWWRDKLRWATWLEGRDFQRVFVHVARYDPYLTLDAALTCLLTENGPKKAEAEEFLLRVARGQARAQRATIEGEARRVEEGTLLPVTFRKTTLFLVNHDGEPYVPMKPVVEGMGLTWQPQHRKLTAESERWGIIKMVIPTEGDMQEAVCLPLRKTLGWLMTISPNKVKPELKETIVAYQNECDDVLWQHWNARLEQHRETMSMPNHSLAQGLPDTPPNTPLTFEYLDEKGRPVPIRVAVRQGLGWAAAPGLALGLADSLANLEQACARIPRSWIGSMPSPSGESVDLALSEQALGYLFGQRAHQGPAMAFRAWWFQEVEPVLRGGGARPVEAATKPTEPPKPAANPERVEKPGPEPEPAGEAPESAAQDPLRARFEALTLWCWRREGRKTHAAFPACVAVLTLLWEEARDGEWIAAGTRGGFARRLGLSDGKSVENALRRLRDWGLVEFRPEGAGWPEAIRLHLDNLTARLREAEDAGEMSHGGSR